MTIPTGKIPTTIPTWKPSIPHVFFVVFVVFVVFVFVVFFFFFFFFLFLFVYLLIHLFSENEKGGKRERREE